MAFDAVGPIPQLSAPTADPQAGELQAGTTVSLSSAEEGQIYYTTNGNTPTGEDALYTDPIQINEAVTIKAIAVKDGWRDSEMATFGYTIFDGFDIIVANTYHNSVDFFDPSAYGDVKPVRSILGPLTNFDRPIAVEVYNNEVYVLNHGGHSIEVFDLTDSGNLSPKRRIVEGMSFPSGFVFDNGEIYVANTTFSGSGPQDVTMVSIAQPMLQAVSTDITGTKVTLSFDKKMADPEGKQGQFNITVNDVNNPVTAAALNADNTKIDLTLTTVVANGQTVLVSYTAGDVVSAEGGVLVSFRDIQEKSA